MERFRLFLSQISVITLLLSLLGCTNEDKFVYERTNKHQYQLRLDCSLCGYDVKTRSVNTDDWENNSRIYISFMCSDKRISGFADYDINNELWTLNTDDEIPIGSIGYCEVCFFDGDITIQGKTIGINDNTATYIDQNGTFEHSHDLTIVRANLTPATGRIRFSGNTGTVFRVSGINTLCSYNQLSGELLFGQSSHQLEIGENGVSPYLYATFPEGNNSLIVTVGTMSFFKTCTSDVLTQGKSGIMSLPTTENHEGWEMMQLSLPEIGSLLLSEITHNSVMAQADVSNIGDWQLIDAGFVYSTDKSSPTINDNKVSCGPNNMIRGKIGELKAGTSYYIRAYAINSKGVSYSETLKFTTNTDPRIWDGKSVATTFGGGMGSKENPILIYTAAQLKLLSDNVYNGISNYEKVYFKLMEDIDLNNYEWIPIGRCYYYAKDYYVPFCGCFDGNGHIIKNINITITNNMPNNDETAGFFGCLYGTVRNLAIAGTISGYWEYYSGSIAAFTGTDAMIENCVNYCTLKTGGGIVGTKGYSALLLNCVNYGDGAETGLVNWSECRYILDDANNFWLYDIATNRGNESSGPTNSGFRDNNNNRSFAYGNEGCLLAPNYEEDLVENLNNWVYMHDGEVHYNKWEYKLIDGKYTATLIPE